MLAGTNDENRIPSLETRFERPSKNQDEWKNRQKQQHFTTIHSVAIINNVYMLVTKHLEWFRNCDYKWKLPPPVFGVSHSKMLLRTDSLLFNDVQKWMILESQNRTHYGNRNDNDDDNNANDDVDESSYLHRVCRKHIVCPLIFKCLSRCNHFFVWILTFVFDLFSVLHISLSSTYTLGFW